MIFAVDNNSIHVSSPMLLNYTKYQGQQEESMIENDAQVI